MADFEEHHQQLRDLGLEMAALSVDPEEDARTIADDLGLDFPVLYGLDCQAEVDKIGAYYDEEGEFFHATAFLLQGGTIRQATYSSGPLGRFVAEDVAGMVELYQS